MRAGRNLWVLVLILTTVGAAAPDRETERLRQALDRSPQTGEKPFAPADGSAATVNPPAFVWLPIAKHKGGYLLALARSADFKNAEIIEASISVHIPTATIAPGTWHWRVGVKNSNGTPVWGQTRRFTVPSDVRQWPFPNIDQVVANIPSAHPRLFFPGVKLDQVRSAVKDGMGRQYRSLLDSARRKVGEPLIPEPPRLEGKGPERGRHYAQIIRDTRPPMDAMETCALAWLLSGDRALGEEAKRRLLHFFAWDPEGTSSLFYNDEPAMWVMQRGTRAYDWTYELFTPEERARIEPVMRARAAQFLKRLRGMPFESRPYSSHPARDLGFLGESAISFMHEWPEARDWLAYVLKIYWSVYPAWAEEDGGWQEGPGYWGAYQSFALHFAVALRQATGVDVTAKPFFRNTAYYKLYTNPPYARLSPFGDGQEGPARAGELMYVFSSLFQDPYLRWYADMQHSGPAGAMGLAVYDPRLKAKSPSDLPQARVFPGAGLVAMHDNLGDPQAGAYLVFRSSPFGSVSHGHADQNAFAIEGFGEALAIASGYYPWYGSPHHYQWTHHTKAVNAITFDGGKGQKTRSPAATGRVTHFADRDGYAYCRGDATAAYDGSLRRCIRHVLHARPRTFVIVDEVEAPTPVAFEWRLHALEKMKLNPQDQSIQIHRSQARLAVHLVEPRGLSLAQTDQFDPPAEKQVSNQWHLIAAAPKAARHVFFAVLVASQADARGHEPPPVEIQRLDASRAVDLLAGLGHRPKTIDGPVGARWTNTGVVHEVLLVPAQTPSGDPRLVTIRTEGGKQTVSQWLDCPKGQNVK